MTTSTVPTVDAELLAQVRELAAARADAVDRAELDVRPGLRDLGARGLLGLGAPDRRDGGLLPALHVVEAVARGCLSTAFALWAQRMAIEYLSRARDPDFAAPLLTGLRTGEIIGSSAMAPALKELSGLGTVPVRATPAPGGYRLTGVIPWASNLFPGAVVVLPARVDAPGREHDRLIAAVRVGTPGFTVNEPPHLLALNGTASSSARLADVHVPYAAVVADDLAAFCGALRPTFLLVQTAFCAGLAAESLDQAEQALTGANTTLAGDVHAARAALGSVRERMTRFAAGDPDRAEVTRLRLDAANAALTATRLEATLAGGAGYAARSPASRRLREAAFLPVQSPTEGHLRWDLSR